MVHLCLHKSSIIQFICPQVYCGLIKHSCQHSHLAGRETLYDNQGDIKNCIKHERDFLFLMVKFFGGKVTSNYLKEHLNNEMKLEILCLDGQLFDSNLKKEKNFLQVT